MSIYSLIKNDKFMINFPSFTNLMLSENISWIKCTFTQWIIVSGIWHKKKKNSYEWDKKKLNFIQHISQINVFCFKNISIFF